MMITARPIAGMAFLTKRIFCAALCIAFIANSAPLTALGEAPPKLELLQLGTFHGDEVKARNSSGWLGLFSGAGGGELKSGDLIVEPAVDVVLDEEGKPPTGKLVKFKIGEKTWSAGDEGAPIAIMKGAKLRERSIYGEPGANGKIATGDYMHIGGKDATFSLYATGIALDSCYGSSMPVMIRDYCLKLSRSEAQGRSFHSQTLFCFPYVDFDAGTASLQYTGDLNGDGKPDLLVSASDHYNKGEIRLYLSYDSGGDDMVYEAGRFTSVGC